MERRGSKRVKVRLKAGQPWHISLYKWCVNMINFTWNTSLRSPYNLQVLIPILAATFINPLSIFNLCIFPMFCSTITLKVSHISVKNLPHSASLILQNTKFFFLPKLISLRAIVCTHTLLRGKNHNCHFPSPALCTFLFYYLLGSLSISL